MPEAAPELSVGYHMMNKKCPSMLSNEKELFSVNKLDAVPIRPTL